MANRLFQQLIQQEVPKVNPDVMNGLACRYMKLAEQYIDMVFRSAAKSFPQGLVYVDCQRCTPTEEYYEASRTRNNKRTYDIARSDIYLVKYFFSYYDEKLPTIHIYLPFSREAGTMYLNGALYHITPVLSDKVISPGYDSVFVRLLRDKLIFKRLYHSLVVNDVRETNYVIWSQIHRKVNDKKVEKTTKAETCLSHYLFAQFGFTETFRLYAGFVPVIGLAEINEETYPRDEWVICSSSKIKPKTHMSSFYEPTEIRLAIPAEFWTQITKALVIGFFYVVDHFPERLQVSYLDNITLWRVLLGHIIFSGAFGEGNLYGKVSEHFNSLDDYVDTVVIDKLRENGYHIQSFYDLLALIMSNFNNFVLDNTSSTLSMYGKSLEVLYYMLYDITAGMFNANFALGKIASKRPLTFIDVRETLNKHLRPRAVLNLASGKIITEAVSYSGDHKYMKLTSKITEQESSPGATRGKSKRHVLGTDKHIDPSMVEAGSILFLPKSNPTPTNKINPFINIDLATGTILPNPKFDELRAQLSQQFKGLVDATLEEFFELEDPIE